MINPSSISTIQGSPVFASQRVILTCTSPNHGCVSSSNELVIRLPYALQPSYGGISHLARALGYESGGAETLATWNAHDLTISEYFEDSVRRMSSTNYWDCERFERAVEVMTASIQDADRPTVRIQVGGIDLPSLRAVLTACIRTTVGRLSHLIVEIPNIEHESRADSPRSVHRAAVLRTAEAAGAVFSRHTDLGIEIADCGQARSSESCSSPLQNHDPELEYLFRNDHLAFIGNGTPFAKCQMNALVAARGGEVNVLFEHLDLLRELASSGEEVARASSMKAVAIARFKGAEMWAVAEEAVADGFRGLKEPTTDTTRMEKGWLHNNLALIHVLRYIREADSAELIQASSQLQRAFEECVRGPASLNSALHLNLTANALRLLELDQRYAEALALLEGLQGASEHAAHLYRKAVLLCRLHRPAECLEMLRQADALCSPRQWPFKLAIAAATAYTYALRDNFSKATKVLEASLALAVAKRSHREVQTLLPNFFYCLCNQYGIDAAARMVSETLDNTGLDIVGSLRTLPSGMTPPPSKLPPFIPELDLSRAIPSRHLINSMLDQKLQSSRIGVTQ